MSICQLRLNMNYEVYINKDDPVKLLSDIIEDIYQETDFTKYTKEEYNGKIPERIMMKILIYGYMCGSYSSRIIESRCHRGINFMYLLEDHSAPNHSTIARFRKNVSEIIEIVFYKII